MLPLLALALLTVTASLLLARRVPERQPVPVPVRVRSQRLRR